MNNRKTIDEAFEIENTLIEKMPNVLEKNKVYLTNDISFMQSRLTELYSMLEKAYEDKGGLIVKSANEFLDNVDYIKIVFSDDNSVLAFISYSTYAGGKKLYLGAAVKNSEGKEAIQKIIQSDIEPYNNWFWGEVSGPIEHYFKKHNGHPIPKELVSRFLATKRQIVPSSDPDDPVHYTRQIGPLSDFIEKALYGFKDEAMAKEVMESIDNYEEFRLNANSLPDKMNESEDLAHLNDALDIIIELMELHNEMNFNEMLPSWRKSLDKSLTYLKSNLPKIAKTNRIEQVKSAIKHGENLKKYMPLLQLHKFHLS